MAWAAGRPTRRAISAGSPSPCACSLSERSSSLSAKSRPAAASAMARCTSSNTCTRARACGDHAVGDLLPAPADIDAGEVQPPEQRRGVAQIQQDAAPARAQQAVVDRERRGMVLAVDMVEREVPGIVDGEEAARGPVRLARLVPVDPLVVAALHLEHVADRMDAPDVLGIGGHGRPPSDSASRSRRPPRARRPAWTGRSHGQGPTRPNGPAPRPGARAIGVLPPKKSAWCANINAVRSRGCSARIASKAALVPA